MSLLGCVHINAGAHRGHQLPMVPQWSLVIHSLLCAGVFNEGYLQEHKGGSICRTMGNLPVATTLNGTSLLLQKPLAAQCPRGWVGLHDLLPRRLVLFILYMYNLHVWACVSMLICACTCVWRPDVNVKSLLPSLTLAFEDRVFLGRWSSQIWLKWTANELPRLSYFHLPRAGFTECGGLNETGPHSLIYLNA